ncbi:ABC transporter permease [Terrarubrum flagellatum]|uniref:ABC transporter permease n=1 Tax=Terrirubrum flagellatum TaxID=2895980 RepID=UPI003145030D
MSVKSGSRLPALGRAYLAFCFVFLLLPIATLIVFSFQRNQYASIPGQGWSLRWYQKLFSDGSLLDALQASLVVSPLAATGACVVGFFAAYAIHRYRFRGRVALMLLIMTPMLIPALILGIGFLGLLSRFGLQGELYSVILSHIVLVTAPAMALIQLRLSQMPESLEEAARNLGATEWQSLTRIVLPWALPGIAGGWILAFTFSFDEFVIAWFVCGFHPTLPVAIYAYIVGSADPSLNAMAAIIFLLSCVMLLCAELILAPFLADRRVEAPAVA